MWIQPKTDWSGVDGEYFNVGDYNRIKGNIQYIWELAQELYSSFDITDMGEDKVYSGLWYPDEFNTLEVNLTKIRGGTYPWWTGETKTWYENQAFLDFNDLNRIESACLTMYEYLQGQKKGRPRLSFRLGQGRCGICR